MNRSPRAAKERAIAYLGDAADTLADAAKTLTLVQRNDPDLTESLGSIQQELAVVKRRINVLRSDGFASSGKFAICSLAIKPVLPSRDPALKIPSKSLNET